MAITKTRLSIHSTGSIVKNWESWDDESCHLWNGWQTCPEQESRVSGDDRKGRPAPPEQSLSDLNKRTVNLRILCSLVLGREKVVYFFEQAALKISNPCQSIYKCFAVSVADPGYLSRIRICASRILDHGSSVKIFRIPDPDSNQRKYEIWSRMLIPDLGSGFGSGSLIQGSKSTRSRIPDLDPQHCLPWYTLITD
jgi:hypothetical protein